MGAPLHGRSHRSLVLLLLLGLGCESPVDSPVEADSTPKTRLSFDPGTGGAIEGQVCWEGEQPVVPPYRERPSPLIPQARRGERLRPNPAAPEIDLVTGGVRHLLVFLRGVDPSRARPWDHPPVRVELQDQTVRIHQGETISSLGMVRRGDPVTVVSRDSVLHSLHVRGAAFCTLALPDPETPRIRRLDQPGFVELTSAAGYFWMRGHLLVSEHPYCTQTDGTGRFRLTGVPPGDYELVCWRPDWRHERHERDPETSCIVRLVYRPAREVTHPVRLRTQETVNISLKVNDARD